MADVTLREVSDTHVDFTTNAQAYTQGRFSLPLWLTRWWGLESGKSVVAVEVSSRTKSGKSSVRVTSGAEIVVPQDDPLFSVLRPKARINVRVYRPAAKPSLKQLLISDEARADLAIPPRGGARRRPIEAER